MYGLAIGRLCGNVYRKQLITFYNVLAASLMAFINCMYYMYVQVCLHSWNHMHADDIILDIDAAWANCNCLAKGVHGEN